LDCGEKECTDQQQTQLQHQQQLQMVASEPELEEQSNLHRQVETLPQGMNQQPEHQQEQWRSQQLLQQPQQQQQQLQRKEDQHEQVLLQQVEQSQQLLQQQQQQQRKEDQQEQGLLQQVEQPQQLLQQQQQQQRKEDQQEQVLQRQIEQPQQLNNIDLDGVQSLLQPGDDFVDSSLDENIPEEDVIEICSLVDLSKDSIVENNLKVRNDNSVFEDHLDYDNDSFSAYKLLTPSPGNMRAPKDGFYFGFKDKDIDFWANYGDILTTKDKYRAWFLGVRLITATATIENAVLYFLKLDFIGSGNTNTFDWKFKGSHSTGSGKYANALDLGKSCSASSDFVSSSDIIELGLNNVLFIYCCCI